MGVFEQRYAVPIEGERVPRSDVCADGGRDVGVVQGVGKRCGQSIYVFGVSAAGRNDGGAP